MKTLPQWRGRPGSRIMQPGLNPAHRKRRAGFVPIGPDLVTDGDFSSGAAWTTGLGWSIVPNEAVCDGSQLSNSDLSQSVDLVAGVAFIFTFDLVGYTAGGVTPFLQGVAGTLRQIGLQTYQEIITSSTNGGSLILKADSAFIGSVDNVSLFRAKLL